MSIGAKLAAFREIRNLTQRDIINALAEHNVPISKSRWQRIEADENQLKLDEFFAFCEIYHIEFPLEEFSDCHSPFLNAEGMRKLHEYAEDLIATGKYQPERKTGRFLPLFLLPASAGLGQLLDSDSYEDIEVPEGVSAAADFGIRVAGNSMEPMYHDGEIVWVQKRENVEVGEIGIFYLNGEAYIKKLGQDENGPVLISLNSDYEPIHIMESSDFYVFGKVVN